MPPLDLKSDYEHSRKVLEIRIKSPDWSEEDLSEIVTEFFAKLGESTQDLSFEYTIGDEV